MTKNIKFIEVQFEGAKISQNEIHKFRGYMAQQNPDNEYMHNHVVGSDKVIYRYPMVQYKRKNGSPFLLAYGEAIPSVYAAVMDTEEIQIESRTEAVSEVNIRLCQKKIGDSSSTVSYKFISPWVCLKEENYEKYMSLPGEEKEGFLKGMLIGNILSLCSGFDVQIENQLTVDMDVKEISTLYKGVQMVAFIGGFSVNCNLPTMCGLGKGVSRGMGTFVKESLKREHENDES